MNELSALASGVVIPPGLKAPDKPLPEGKHQITIKSLDPENGYDAKGKPIPSDHLMARCVYPDGSEKNHQVMTMDDLLPKVINQLRGRFGFKEAKITALPKAMKAGAVIEMEVTNG